MKSARSCIGLAAAVLLLCGGPAAAYQGGSLRNHGHTNAAGDGGVLGTINVTSVSITGNSFAVGGSTVVVKAGRVGILTGAPAFDLDVNGRVRTTDLFYNSAQNASQIVLNHGGSGFGQIQNDANNVWSLGFKPTLGTALGTSVLAWNTSGHVGIGTIAPCSTCTLHVAGSVAITSTVTLSLSVSSPTVANSLYANNIANVRVTFTGANPAVILEQVNVTSVTFTSSGDWDIIFARPFLNLNYTPIATGDHTATCVPMFKNRFLTQVSINTQNIAGSDVNCDKLNVVIFGAQ